MNKILITGVSGAVGSNLAKYLLKSKSNHIIGIDNLSSSSKDNIANLDLTFIEGDVLDNALLEEVFSKNNFNYIFHLAAHFANQNSIDHPISDLKVNAAGTVAILENIKLFQKKVKRFVYTSTSCIYLQSDKLLEEENSLHFETPYAISKYFGEEYIRFYSSYYKIKSSIVRLFNSYGPGEMAGKYRNVIPNFIELALNDKPITIFGTGEETRSFTYVDDIIKGIVGASKVKSNDVVLLNIGGSKEIKIKALADLIIKLSESKSEIIYTQRRSWDKTLRRRPDISKARKTIKFDPKIDIIEGLTKTIGWFRENCMNYEEKNEIKK